MITEAYEKLNRVKALVLYPIMLDFIAFLLGIAIVDFPSTSTFTLQFSLNPGLPSINHVIEQNVMVNNGLYFSSDPDAFPMAMLFTSIFFLLIGAFIQAGFIGLLYHAIFTQGRISFQTFLKYGSRFWSRLLLVEVIVIVVMIVGGLFTIPFGLYGIVAFLLALFILRILFIYWEFTIIVEDISVIHALKRSWQYFRNRVPETMNVIVTILLLNLLVSFLVNSIWNIVTFVLAIFVYGYLATGLQVTLMMTLQMIMINSTTPEEKENHIVD